MNGGGECVWAADAKETDTNPKGLAVGSSRIRRGGGWFSDAPVFGLLPRGVYAVEVAGVRGIANYGVAPTLGERAWKEPVLEIHFLGREPPRSALVNDVAEVSLLRFIRAERRFDSLDELKTQIAADCAAVDGT